MTTFSRDLRRQTNWSPVFLWLLAVLAALAIAILPLELAVALLAVSIVIILTLITPLFGLGVALLLGPFGALEGIILGNTLLDSGQAALLLTFAAWIGAGLARRRLYLPRTTLNMPLLLFIGVTLLSLLDARSIQLGLVELIKWLEILLIIWLVADIASAGERNRKRTTDVIRTLLAVLLAVGLSQALIGIWQFGLRGRGPEHFIVLDRFYRAYGTFEQPNPFGGFMNLTALLAAGSLIGLSLAWWHNRRQVRSTTHFQPIAWWWIFSLLTAAATSLALIFSWSRGAWLGFIAGSAVLVLFGPRRLRVGILILLLVGAVFFGGLQLGLSIGFAPAASVADRLGGFQDEFTIGDVRGVDINDANYAVLERLAHWQAAVDMARDDLWSGVGFGNYEAAYPEYALINWPAALGHAHNYYLNLLAEIGLPGLLAYLFFWGVVAWQSIRLTGVLGWPERGVVVGLLAAWTALAVHHLVDKLYVNNIYVHLGAMLALLQLLAWPDLSDEIDDKRRVGPEK